MPLKQIIVMRTDLNMRKGKMVVQGAHASLMLDIYGLKTDEQFRYYRQWIRDGMRKICVGVNSYPELITLYDQAVAVGIAAQIVVDAAHTEFKEPTTTCIAIGPAPAEEIDKITGHLKLL